MFIISTLQQQQQQRKPPVLVTTKREVKKCKDFHFDLKRIHMQEQRLKKNLNILLLKKVFGRRHDECVRRWKRIRIGSSHFMCRQKIGLICCICYCCSCICAAASRAHYCKCRKTCNGFKRVSEKCTSFNEGWFKYDTCVAVKNLISW